MTAVIRRQPLAFAVQWTGSNTRTVRDLAEANGFEVFRQPTPANGAMAYLEVTSQGSYLKLRQDQWLVIEHSHASAWRTARFIEVFRPVGPRDEFYDYNVHCALQYIDTLDSVADLAIPGITAEEADEFYKACTE